MRLTKCSGKCVFKSFPTYKKIISVDRLVIKVSSIVYTIYDLVGWKPPCKHSSFGGGFFFVPICRSAFPLHTAAPRDA